MRGRARTLVLPAGEPVPPAAEDKYTIRQPPLGGVRARCRIRTQRRAMLAQDGAHSRRHRRLRTNPASQEADVRARTPSLLLVGTKQSTCRSGHHISGWEQNSNEGMCTSDVGLAYRARVTSCERRSASPSAAAPLAASSARSTHAM